LQNGLGQSNLAPVPRSGQVPNLAFQYHLGDSVHSSNLEAYRGQLIILDFWTVTCPSCIFAMGELEQLQQRFGDKLRIILVTSDSQTRVQRFIKRIYRTAEATARLGALQRLPVIYGDSQLCRLFPHRVFPTHAWIDSQGRLFSQCYGNSTTPENVSRYLAGQPVNLNEQKIIDFRMRDPLSWPRLLDAAPSYSLFFKGFEVGEGYKRNLSYTYDSVSGAETGIACFNFSIIELYKLAYADFRPTVLYEIPANRIHVETRDSSKYFPPTDVDDDQAYQWFLDHCYCFALQLPAERRAEFLPAIRRALDDYLSIKSQVNRVRTLCYVLQCKPGANLRSNGGTSENRNRQTGLLRLKNAKPDQLRSYLNVKIRTKLDNLPLIDETGLNYPIDLEISWQEDLQEARYSSLVEALAKKGLILKKDYRSIPMLVLRDK
jgi:thiol-disulfide isomerase/thioredoxin